MKVFQMKERLQAEEIAYYKARVVSFKISNSGCSFNSSGMWRRLCE